MRRLRLIFMLAILANTVLAQFQNVSSEAGIEHISVSPILMGGGAVFIDYNNDGWQDIIVTGGITNDRVYKNINGERFEEDLLALPYYRSSSTLTSAVLALDYNNDGCRDLLVCNFNKSETNFLLENNCEGGYIDVTNESGIFGKAASMGAAIRDINDDGFQDIYIINYIEQVGFIRDASDNVIDYDHQCYSDFIFINNGDGTFTESSAALEVSSGCGLAVIELDFLEDETKGFYVANDFGEYLTPNQVVNYNQSGSSYSGLDIGLYAMGIAVGDIDQDLDLDLYVTNFGSNALLFREGDSFVDRAAEFGVENRISTDTFFSVSWGTFFIDIDNDSDQDLFVSNGYIPSSSIVYSGQFDANKLFLNADGVMNDRTEIVGLDDVAIGRGAIRGDYDNDGYLDILVCNINSADVGSTEARSYKLYRNITGDAFPKNYLKLFLKGAVDKDAYGTIATSYRNGIGNKQILLSSGTHASQSEKSLHFGLGSEEMIDSLVIKWSNGASSNFYDLPTNKSYLADQGESTIKILGCTDTESSNYDASAEVSWGCEFSSSTNVRDNKSSVQSYTINPNPVTTNTSLSVQLVFDTYQTDVQIQVLDVLGESYFEQSINVNGVALSTNIPVSRLSKGVYFILVSDDQGVTSKKFIKL